MSTHIKPELLTFLICLALLLIAVVVFSLFFWKPKVKKTGVPKMSNPPAPPKRSLK